MTSNAASRACPRCHSVASGGQRYCRACGTNLVTGDPSSEIPRPRPPLRPLSRALIVMVVAVCLALGAALAVAWHEARDDGQPPPPTGMHEPVSQTGPGDVTVHAAMGQIVRLG